MRYFYKKIKNIELKITVARHRFVPASLLIPHAFRISSYLVTRLCLVMHRRTLCVHSQDSTRFPLLIKKVGAQSVPWFFTPREGRNERLKLLRICVISLMFQN